MLADRGKAAVFARYVLIQTSLAVLPVCVIAAIGRASLLTSLAIAVGLFVVAMILAFPLRLWAMEYKVRKRGRTLDQLAAMTPVEFAAEMRTPLARQQS